MLFRGLDNTPIRIAYMLAILNYLTAIGGQFVISRSGGNATAIFSALILLYCVLAGLLTKPRNLLPAVHSLLGLGFNLLFWPSFR